MSEVRLIRDPDAGREKFSWGKMQWYCGHDQGKSQEMTFARCQILPDCTTHEHHHADCEEIVHVIDGIVRHHQEGKDTFLELTPGDTMVIPPRVEHQMENVDDEEADLVIVWSSTQRQVYKE